MNWLTCTQCGRRTYSRNPAVVDELGRGAIRILCPCGATGAWIWATEAESRSDVARLRELHRQAARNHDLRSLAIRVGDTQSASPAVPHPSYTGPAAGQASAS